MILDAIDRLPAQLGRLCNAGDALVAPEHVAGGLKLSAREIWFPPEILPLPRLPCM